MVRTEERRGGTRLVKPTLLGLILLGTKKGHGLQVPNLRPALGL